MRKIGFAVAVIGVLIVGSWAAWLIKLQRNFDAKQENYAARSYYARMTMTNSYRSSSSLDQTKTRLRLGDPSWIEGSPLSPYDSARILFISNPNDTAILAQQDFQTNFVATNQLQGMRQLGFTQVIISNGVNKWSFPLNEAPSH